MRAREFSAFRLMVHRLQNIKTHFSNYTSHQVEHRFPQKLNFLKNVFKLKNWLLFYLIPRNDSNHKINPEAFVRKQIDIETLLVFAVFWNFI